MTRTFVGLVILAFGLAVPLVGCAGETSEPMETAPDAIIETVALTVEGMT